MLSLDQIKSKARKWLGPEFTEETRKEVRDMLEKDEKRLVKEADKGKEKRK